MGSIEAPEDGVLDSEIPAATPGEETPMASFGEELRRQRELRSVSLREISDATKINIRFLEALEENDFKHLPGGQFNKGFIRAYARHIGVDGEDMVNAYIVEVRRQEDEAPAARVSAPRQRLDPADKRALIALGVLAALIVLLGLGVWFFFFHGRKSVAGVPENARAAHTRPSKATSQPAAPAAAEPAPVNPATATSAPGTPGSVPAQEGDGQGHPAPGVQTPAPASPTPVTALPPAAEAGDPRTSSAAPPGTEMILRVVPLAAAKLGLLCDGKEIYSGTIEPGRPLSFTCARVYEITVEDAGAVNLSIDGERIYVGRPGQSSAGRHVSRANLPDFLNPPFEQAGR